MNGKYQKLAKKLGIKENIKFLGYRKDIPKLMQISNLAVSTSKQEGLPVNLIEAMMIGLPIIATNCRGNRDLIYENIVDIDDVRTLSKLIEKEMNNKTNDKIYYENIELYEIKKIISQMEKIYEGDR